MGRHAKSEAEPASLLVLPPGTVWFSTPPWHAIPDDAELLRVLTAAACPAPCRGQRDPGGMDWHELCEQKARQALAILRGVGSA